MKFQFRRHARGEFNHLAIEERHSHFEIRGHGGFVGSYQIQTRQERFEIDVEQSV